MLRNFCTLLHCSILLSPMGLAADEQNHSHLVPPTITSLLIRLYASLWEGTGGASVMPSSSSTSSLQSGRVTVCTISFPSSTVQEFLLTIQHRNCPLSFSCIDTQFTLYLQLFLTMSICHDTFVSVYTDWIYVILAIKLLIFINMNVWIYARQDSVWII